jgi:outer membrane biosynthesis protein TonB
MKHTTILISILALAACGGKKSAPAQPKEPEPAPEPAPAPKPEPAPEPEPPPPPPPPPPKSWHAQAALTPVKGAKIKAATVTFAQTEGKGVAVGSTGWFDGIKSGKYHLVVHDAAACGPNATKAGKPVADIEFFAAKGMDALDVAESAAVQLAGDGTIVGHTLVLHDDKKGKPGKALACGPIASAEGP